jgi:transposase
LAGCKVDGILLGLPRGVALKLRLDEQAKKVDDYQALKLNKRGIAKLLGVSPNTLHTWLRRGRPETVSAGEVAGSGTAQPATS